MNIVGLILGALVGAIFSGLIIWIVGKLGWGIEVDGFGPAYVAALVIAVLNVFANWVWGVIGYTPEGGWLGAVTHLILAAGFMVAAGNWVKGLRVKGFSGALIASFFIAAVGWLVTLGLNALI